MMKCHSSLLQSWTVMLPTFTEISWVSAALATAPPAPIALYATSSAKPTTPSNTAIIGCLARDRPPTRDGRRCVRRCRGSLRGADADIDQLHSGKKLGPTRTNMDGKAEGPPTRPQISFLVPLTCVKFDRL